MAPTPRRWFETGLTAAGALLLAYLVYRTGLGVLWTNIVNFGPWFLVTGAVALLWLWLQAASWWLVQKRVWPEARLLPLWRVKIICDGFNFILPSAGVGGDAMRPYLARAHVPLEHGIPAVVFDKTIEVVASVVFIGPVLLVGLLTIELPAGVALAATISLAITTVAILLLVAGLRVGLTTVLLGLARVAPGLRTAVQRRHDRLRAIDDSLARLHAAGVKATLVPLTLHVLSRVVGGLEVIVVMAVLGAPVTAVQALFVCAVVTIGNTVFFLLPGQWGVAESVHVVVVRSLGYPPAVGLSLALLRRIRRLLMVVVSLAFYAADGRSRAGVVEANGQR
jgi:glycosyltransferase 2 family protein